MATPARIQNTLVRNCPAPSARLPLSSKPALLIEAAVASNSPLVASFIPAIFCCATVSCKRNAAALKEVA